MYQGSLNELFAGFAGHNIGDITIEEPGLEEIFMNYYEKECVSQLSNGKETEKER